MRSSARRLAIPELPEEVFIESLRQLIAVDQPWVPPAGGEESLYLRPHIFATEAGLGVRPASEYRYLVIASPAGAYFKGGIKPVSVWLSTEYVRACPGGTGAAKFGGNYAASLLAQAQAIENDCDQVVWLDAAERRFVEEMGGMNLFFVFGSGGTARLVTPELSGSILPGVTRDALLQLATDAGFAVEERRDGNFIAVSVPPSLRETPSRAGMTTEFPDSVSHGAAEENAAAENCDEVLRCSVALRCSV